MPRTGRPPHDETRIDRGQLPLELWDHDADAQTYRQARGPVTMHGEYVRAIERTVAAAERDDQLGELDAAAVAMLVAGARSLEALEGMGKPYGTAKMLPPMTEVLRELRLTPESRPQATTGDKIDALLAELARNDEEPSDDADAGTAEIRDRA